MWKWDVWNWEQICLVTDCEGQVVVIPRISAQSYRFPKLERLQCFRVKWWVARAPCSPLPSFPFSSASFPTSSECLQRSVDVRCRIADDP